MITWAQAQLKLGTTFILDTNEQGAVGSKVTSFVMGNTTWLNQVITDSVGFYLIVYKYREVFLKTETQVAPLFYFF